MANKKYGVEIWMPLVVSDLLAETAAMSTAEIGALVLLRMHAWKNRGVIPCDPSKLALVTKMSPGEWAKSAPTVLACWELDGEGYRCQVTDDAIAVAIKNREQKSAAGKAAAAAAAKRMREQKENQRATDDATDDATEGATEWQREGNSASASTTAPASGHGDVSKVVSKETTVGVPAPAKKSAGAARKTGTRLPEDWQLPKRWGEWALQERSGWTVEHVRSIAATFRDHWIQKVGKDATSLDWEARWRNWIRREPKAGATNRDAKRATREATTRAMYGANDGKPTDDAIDITADSRRVA